MKNLSFLKEKKKKHMYTDINILADFNFIVVYGTTGSGWW